MRHSLAALAFGLLVAFVAGEAVVRLSQGFPLLPLVPPPVPPAPRVHVVPSPTRGYALPPNDGGETNSAGLRDDEYPLAKPPGTFRVVGLGDSVTYGYRVARADTFLERLERALNAGGRRRFEVLNFGVPGYNTTQELAMLREVGLAYQPDLVLLTYVLNDADAEVVPEGWLGRAPTADEPPPLLAQTVGRFYLPQLLYGAYGRWRGGALNPAAEAPGAKFADGSPGWEASRAALREMAALARAHGIPLVVAIFPFLVQLDDRYPYAAVHEVVARAVAEAGAEPIDLLPAFKGQAARPLWVGPADYHPNARGHQIAAEALYRELAGRGLVPVS